MRARRTNTGVRFPADMYEQLRRAADERDVSVNWLVNRAVVDFLARLIPADELRLTHDAPPLGACPGDPAASPCDDPRPHDPHTYPALDAWLYCSGRTHPARIEVSGGWCAPVTPMYDVAWPAPPVAEAPPGAPGMFFDRY